MLRGARPLGVAAMLALWLAAWSSSGQPSMAVKVERPQPGEGVGAEVAARGVATVPADHNLWLLARQTPFAPLWWPQRPPTLDPSSGRWHGTVAVGVPGDVGADFDIAVAVADAAAQSVLTEYLSSAMRSNDWRPIELPKGAVVVEIVTVRKIRP